MVPAERPEPRPDVTGDLSPRAEKAKVVVGDMLKLMDLQLEPHVVEDGDKEIHVDLQGEDEARIIGKKGDVLLSFQFLVNRMVSKAISKEAPEEASEEEGAESQVVVLDAAAYRVRRRDALSDLAKRLADRAVEEGKVVRLSPMSAHDRRVFHLTLKEMEGIDTRSEGDGLYRNLLIIPSQFA